MTEMYTEVKREHVADWGIKRNEKVDYAIMQDEKAIMLIECKKLGQIRERAAGSQLSRYFDRDDNARIGILTDGEIYKFFSDLNRDNLMDETPFFQFDMQQFTEQDIRRLEMFTKPLFKLDDIVQEARRAKAVAAVEGVLAGELSSPSDGNSSTSSKDR